MNLSAEEMDRRLAKLEKPESWIGRLEEIDAMIAAGKVLCPDCVKKNRCSIYRDYGEKAKGCTGYKQGRVRNGKGDYPGSPAKCVMDGKSVHRGSN